MPQTSSWPVLFVDAKNETRSFFDLVGHSSLLEHPAVVWQLAP